MHYKVILSGSTAGYTCPVHGHRAGSKWPEWAEWTDKKKPMDRGTIGLKCQRRKYFNAVLEEEVVVDVGQSYTDEYVVGFNKLDIAHTGIVLLVLDGIGLKVIGC